MQLNLTVTTQILDNLTEATARFTSGDLTWKWESVNDQYIRYIAYVNDAENAMRLLVEIPWGSGYTHLYNQSAFYWEDSTVVSVTQTTTARVKVPGPSTSELAAMTTFTAVLNFMAAFVDKFVHTP